MQSGRLQTEAVTLESSGAYASLEKRPSHLDTVRPIMVIMI